MISDSEKAGIARSTLFEGVAKEAIEGLCAQAGVVSFEAGHQLFQRGETANDLMILQQGVVELLIPVEIMSVSRDVTFESKQSGAVVAWSALVSPFRFTLSARCASKCTLASFNREMLWAFFDTDPRTGFLFMRNLSGVIGRRLQAMETMWLHDLQANATKHLE